MSNKREAVNSCTIGSDIREIKNHIIQKEKSE